MFESIDKSVVLSVLFDALEQKLCCEVLVAYVRSSDEIQLEELVELYISEHAVKSPRRIAIEDRHESIYGSLSPAHSAVLLVALPILAMQLLSSELASAHVDGERDLKAISE